MRTNLILMTDSYKASHFLQYPAGTTTVFSYIEARGGGDWTLFFGLQMFIKEYLSKPICLLDIDEAEAFFTTHGEPFNREGWLYILRKYNGYLPIEIKAVREGTIVPTHNVLVTIKNKDANCIWLTSYVETMLLRAVWYPTTVATNSKICKNIILKYLEETGDPAGVNFKLHDFGARGVSSRESAMIGGAAHLVNFMGSDTVEGIYAANLFYNEKMAAYSIPAAEHSTITTWGRDNEALAFANMLKQFARPGSILAVVSDSYDIYHACRELWGNQLKDAVLNSGATIVVRPDSGDPLTVPVEVVEILMKQFGFTVNDKGYKVLPSCVRVIQGDGITVETLPVILENMKAKGLSADNIAFGMGGGLLQQVNRDTFKFAMKTSAALINGEWVEVYKDPVGDKGKISKRGILDLVCANGQYKTVSGVHNLDSVLHTVYDCGMKDTSQTLAQIRERSMS